MDSLQIVDEFERSWTFTRQMTHDFITAVPAERWNFTPHPKYSPLCKQFRHMIWVTGLYREAMRKETTPGIFYLKSKGFLHFHIKGDRRWADVRDGSNWGSEFDIPFEPSQKIKKNFLKEVKARYFRTVE